VIKADQAGNLGRHEADHGQDGQSADFQRENQKLAHHKLTL
jgi:hypothetical protein